MSTTVENQTVKVYKPYPTSQPKLWTAVPIKDGKFLNDRDFSSESFWTVAVVASLRWGWSPTSDETRAKLNAILDLLDPQWKNPGFRGEGHPYEPYIEDLAAKTGL